jgi:hypothetical protein
MRTFYALLVLGVVACSFGRAGAAGFTDGICPGATQYVIAAGKLRPNRSITPTRAPPGLRCSLRARSLR